MHFHLHGPTSGHARASEAGAASDASHTELHREGQTGALAGSVGATLLLVAVELAGGIAARSVALVSDAVHNMSDLPSLGIAWFGARWAGRPADSEKTYGYQRGEFWRRSQTPFS